MKRRQRSHPSKTGPPKGSYRLPDGGYAIVGKSAAMPNSRRLNVVGHVRVEPDLELLAKILVERAREVALRNQRKADDAGTDRAA